MNKAILILLFVALSALQTFVFYPNATHKTLEPLADPKALQLLIQGIPLPKPAEEPLGQFHGIYARSIPLAQLTQTRKVLGITSDQSNQTEKWIAVDLTRQRVWAFEGAERIHEFIVSTGKWYHTPTGEFRIWAKVRSQKMEGGNPKIGTYYNLPNVPYVMFYSNDAIAKMRGFSLHGAYWHDNFGHPMSHGCVNMKIDDARVLYDWANPPVVNPKAWSTLATADNPGTRVVVYGETPQE